ncbi:sulfatase-like hydrolase/transferase, partial [bacterium]|nr:sulfatase-like hydrolase/transferase [bacterium]
MRMNASGTGLALAVTLSAITSVFAQSKKGENPNILLIMTDQQAWDAVAYSGNKLIKTPNLDRLASEGVNFSQAITACPVSVPARTSILTGRLTETTTIRENNDINSNDCFYPTFDEI